MTRIALYPGTFDPVHHGHLDLMQRGANLFDELVIGVYDHSRPTKSVLFPVETRIAMIEEAVKNIENIRVLRFSGLLVEFARSIECRIILRGLRVFSDFEFEFRSALANKRLAPEMETVSLMTREEHMFLSGTTVREIASLHGNVQSMVPAHVAELLYQQFGRKESEGYNRPVPLRD